MPENGERKCGPRRLRPGSVETIRNGLFFYRTDRPTWIDRYFPAIAERGSVEYGDIDAMSQEQAGAIRLLLTDGLVYWLSRQRKTRAASAGLLSDGQVDGEADLECQIQIRKQKEALRDLCNAFGFPDPTDDA